ncbi:hypothetical protein SAMN05878249_0837 [Vreelandella aquamarina]|uniref:Uncharacterized protein n=1 Tax=Vreelandella aquamarina TaxID=77097 RepID=A0A1N6DAK3_9GAMM|nr:hypothetical protein SAMN05878249_0837 [Halomonas meridiana]SIN67830.1 hypothetical protein SAMN05878438_2270 [Halomonas meridiana]SIN92999.1 hypothetical protein SAMN05878442_0117 [Halomonas meridiana]
MFFEYLLLFTPVIMGIILTIYTHRLVRKDKK